LLKLIRAAFAFLNIFSPKLGGRWALKLFLTPLRLKYNRKDKQLIGKGKSKTLIYKDLYIHYNEWGAGKVVICVHGWSGKGPQFHAFVDVLVAAGYCVVTVDFPGHGRSDGKMTNVPEFALVLEELLKLYPTCKTLLGHSIGGMVCILAAIKTENKIKKLVTICTPTVALNISARFMGIVGANERVHQSFIRAIEKQFKQSFKDFSAYLMAEQLVGKVDFLVVGDDTDPEVSVENTMLIQKSTNAQLLITKGLGHNKPLRDPEVIERVVGFIRG
jgi:esterase/lipase